jgi:hypothetical protein
MFVVDQEFLCGTHCFFLPLGVSACDYGPGLRIEVDATFTSLRTTEYGTVIVVASNVPVSAPGILDVPLQFLSKASIGAGTHMVPPQPAHGLEAPADVDEKPGHPDALAIALDTDFAQAVIPVAGSYRGQTVPSKRHSRVDSATAVLVDVSRVIPMPELGVTFVLRFGERQSAQERHNPIQQAEVPGSFEITGNDIRKPEQIVRTTGSYAAEGVFVPPVENVTFRKLSGSGLDDVSRRLVGLIVQQRQDVL